MSVPEIENSARKRGIADEDMLHAARYPIAVVAGSNDVALYLGPARDGTLLEVGLVLDDRPRIVHAMALRTKFYRYLEQRR